MPFFSSLEARVKAVDSLLCIGLDPHAGDLPEQSGRAALAFCLRLIEATADLAAAFKPNAAFFERLGPEGVTALRDVIAAVPEGIPVILDAKRGDIASTAQAYAAAAFQALGADALTVNPYLGRDAVEPFLADPQKGVFLLCKTSNPGAADLQDLWVTVDRGQQSGAGGLPSAGILYEHVARLAQQWNTRGNLGLVVGATQVEALERVRALAPDLWILAPGVGAQGGDLEAALAAGLRPDGMGVLVPVSRAISRSDDPRQAAIELRDAINAVRSAVSGQPSTLRHLPDTIRYSALADGLLQAGCIRFGRFTLKSGIESPVYIDLRRLAGFPELLRRVAAAYADVLRGLQFDVIAALPYAALPIATAISLQNDWPLVYPRKEVKTYGTKAVVEGVFSAGQRAVVIDDLISTGGSKFEGIEKLESAGLEVKDVVVLIDRRPPGADELAARGYTLHAVLTIADLLDYYARTGAVREEKIAAARKFFASAG